MIDFKARIIWIPVYNSTAEIIPGCALMEIVANPPTDNGQDVDGNWIVRKPTIDGNTRVLVNSEVEIPPGGFGVGHRDNNAVLLYDTTVDLPLCNDQYGSKNGSWMAYRNNAGFRIDHAGNGRANASRDLAGGTGTAQKAVMITTGTLVPASGGDLAYYAATEQSLVAGAWSTGDTVRAINTGTADPKSGKRYPATFIGYAVDGVTKCYAIKGAKTTVLVDASISCVSGTVTLSKTTNDIDIDLW